MVTYDDIYELIEDLHQYVEYLAPSYDELPKSVAKRIEDNLRTALAEMKKADYMAENVL